MKSCIRFKTVSYLSLFWPLLPILSFGVIDISVSTAIPTACAVLFSFFPSKGAKPSRFAIFLIFASFFYLLASFLLSGFPLSDLFRSFKTFLQPAIYILFFSTLFYGSSASSSRRLALGSEMCNFFAVALFVSFFPLFELFIRFLFPSVGDAWYAYLSSLGFSGSEYMRHGYMNYGFILVGQRPLGFYGDMHTQPILSALCMVFFSVVQMPKPFSLSIFSLISTLRWTYFLFIPVSLVAYRSSLSRALIYTFAIVACGILFFIPFLREDVSFSALASQLSNLTFFLDSLDFRYLFLGHGYHPEVLAEAYALDINELFFAVYLYSFGIVGGFVLLLTMLSPFLLHLRNPATSAAPFLILLIPLMGIAHYNSFFTPIGSCGFAMISVSLPLLVGGQRSVSLI